MDLSGDFVDTTGYWSGFFGPTVGAGEREGNSRARGKEVLYGCEKCQNVVS